MNKAITLSLLALCLVTPRLYADGWETAGKILAGVVIGGIVVDSMHRNTPPPPPTIYKHYPRGYKSWIPGKWITHHAYEMVPGCYETIMVEINRDGCVTYEQREIYHPPSTRPVTVRYWQDGYWTTRY
jgi:hypothetical protein